MTADKLVLIDLSSISRPIYETQIDPQRTSTEIVAKVRALASAHRHVAIACDSRKSFRRDLDPTYKAQRAETPAVYLHELGLAVETLRGDGFPVWAVEGFEADDIIATAAHRASFVNIPHIPDVLIISSDKDLLQLVTTYSVEQFRPANGPTVAKTFDVAAVVERYGVQPHQMLDYLALVGDASDNIKGADGIGEKKAAAMLQKFGNLDDLMAAVEKGDEKFTPSTRKALEDFKPRMDLVRSLLRLRTDVPIQFEEILADRVPSDVAVFSGEGDPMMDATDIEDDIEATMPTLKVPQNIQEQNEIQKMYNAENSKQAEKVEMVPASPFVGLVRHVDAAPVEWQRELEPRDMAQAKELAGVLFASRLFNAYGHPAGVMSTILAGREIGMQAMTALRAFHIIEGKPTLSAGAIHAMVLSSGKAEYFRCSERTPERATFVTKRKGEPEMSLSFTIEEGRTAWSKDDVSWKRSGWGKNPADMLVARASTKLARLVYPDVVHGLYAPEEIEGA